MRCKKHPADFSSRVGVCASCLRESLFVVMAAQAQKEAQLHQAQLDRRKSDTQLPAGALAFPRSVSPYVSQRKSTNSETCCIHARGGNQRFYSTPHVGPNGAVTAEITKKMKKERKSNGGRFSKLFLRIFRSKSYKPDSDSVRGSDPGVSEEYSCTASPSLFSTIVPCRRRKQIRTFSLDEGAIAAHRKAYPNRDCGMSPARDPDEEDDEHCQGGSSGYSSESSQHLKQTPRMTPITARRPGSRAASHTRSISGLAFCLSPLVRPSPNRHWNQIGLPPEMATMVGESRCQTKPRLSTATSFCKNRSRKLADFGRYGHNNTNH